MCCPSRVGPQSSTVYLVHHTSQYSYFVTSLNHHLYADDTQLFFSFYPSVFDSSIIQLQHSLQQISSCTTATILTLTSSKTEFLLVVLPQRRKIRNETIVHNFIFKQRRYCRLLESGMELTRAKRQIDYVSDSGNKN